VDESDARIHLSVPAEPDSISVVRLLVVCVASQLPLTVDTVDDLRIAAAEACALVLSVGSGGRLCVDLDRLEAELLVRVWREPATGREPPARDGLAWRVIEGLTDEAAFGEVDGNVSLDMRVRTLPG
jgi:hypothetical protein